MPRIVLTAAAVALLSWSVTAAAQTLNSSENVAMTRSVRGSTGPTFPAPGAETLIAAAPSPPGINAGADGQTGLPDVESPAPITVPPPAEFNR